MGNLGQEFDQIENCIKTGQFTSAQNLLGKIRLNSLPRQNVLRFSNLARRCGKVQKSLKVLNPFVRHLSAIQPATDEERADYAFSLHRIGASFEAKKLLSELDPAKAPSALFFASIIAFSEWRYVEAEEILQNYIKSSVISDYQSLMGRSNLVNAFIFLGKFQRAEETIGDLLESANKKELGLLKNLCLQQKVELLISQDKMQEALAILKTNQQQMQDSGHLVENWTWKWFEVSQSVIIGGYAGKTRLAEASQNALQRGAWEDARDIDFYRCKHFSDAEAFAKLCIGNPFHSIKEKLKALVQLKEPEEYLLTHNSVNSASTFSVIDWNRQNIKTLDGSEIDFLTSQTHFRLVQSMLSDAYRPKKWGALFNDIFPDEYYNPFGSLNRLHQIVFRLNQKNKELEIPFQVTAHNFGVTFTSPQPIAFRLTAADSLATAEDPEFSLLINNIPKGSEFRVMDLSDFLPGDRRTHQRLLKKYVEDGKLVKLGKGKATRYKRVA